MLTVGTSSIAGAVRPNNEDAVLADAGLGLVAVADGMGGHNAGEVASRLALEALQAFLRSTANGGEEVTWPFGVDEAAAPDSRRLKTAMKLANREVFRTSEERPETAGMGTTLTAALISADGTLHYGNVGDSRLYLYSVDGTLTQQTRDDSLVGLLAGTPGLDMGSLDEHPMKHLLTNVVGRKPDLDVEIAEMKIADGDVLLLCSDGMHGAVPDAGLSLALSEARLRQGSGEPGQDLQWAADRLVQAALAGGSRDNISVVIARYQKA
jgi:serine/threonine protein phosphatase PrpC